MKPTSLVLIAVVAAAVAVVIALKPTRVATVSDSAPTVVATSPSANAATAIAIPRLLDLGAGKCIPCKMMTPILADLKSSYAGALRVDVLDVWENKAAAEPYGISSIPTQIFFAADGKELFRHQGFFAKEDILAQWKTLGFDLKPIITKP